MGIKTMEESDAPHVKGMKYYRKITLIIQYRGKLVMWRYTDDNTLDKMKTDGDLVQGEELELDRTRNIYSL